LPEGGIALSEHLPTEHFGTDIRAAVRDFLADSHPSERNMASIDAVERALEDWFGVASKRVLRPGMTKRQRLYTLPPLTVARDRVLAKKGLRIEPRYDASDDDHHQGDRIVPMRRLRR
jgi:hypothetical protein